MGLIIRLYDQEIIECLKIMHVLVYKRHMLISWLIFL